MNEILKNNMQALAEVNKDLYLRFSSFLQSEKSDNYSFSQSRSAETVPAYNKQPLHSMVDPVREAQRIVSSSASDGFLICLGLGGGFIPKAALEATDAQVTVIDFDIKSIIQLFSHIDYTHLLNNNRFFLLIDPDKEEIKNFVFENYKPALWGGIKTIPLRTRTETDKPLFDLAILNLQETIEEVSADYSVQAHFGKRWFSNIIRNIGRANFTFNKNINAENTAIAAAGPSLDTRLLELKEFKLNGGFVICCDTALAVLLNNNIKPDVIVSIDCQFISYYHFIGSDIQSIPLVLDITSPPLLSRFSSFPCFFSGGHPLVRYISNTLNDGGSQALPILDTSGGNVTYACLSLAEYLGAKHITFFGADFSYINSQTYARGTYIYPFFHKKQNRLSPAEALFSRFLYRSELSWVTPLSLAKTGKYYDTGTLRFYRKKLEEKISKMTAKINFKESQLPTAHCPLPSANSSLQTVNYPLPASLFLKQYRDDIAALPQAYEKENYIKKLNTKEMQIFTTLLPYAAAIRKRRAELKTFELIEEVKQCCIKDIDRIC
ncbi:MAG: DUF115 domain-containing protein [Treponema sp.]|nr:DUF115 domain-containing protein [Treponema sp.]